MLSACSNMILGICIQMRLLDYEKDITNNGGSLFPIIKSNVLNPGRRPGELTLSRCVLVGSDLKSNNDSMFAIVCLQSKNVSQYGHTKLYYNWRRV